jgi:hypothetical protein
VYSGWIRAAVYADPGVGLGNLIMFTAESLPSLLAKMERLRQIIMARA